MASLAVEYKGPIGMKGKVRLGRADARDPCEVRDVMVAHADNLGRTSWQNRGRGWSRETCRSSSLAFRRKDGVGTFYFSSEE